MPISFEQIPPNILLPLFYAEVTSAAEPVSPGLKLLLIGHMNKGVEYREGTAIENTLYLLSGDTANALFGRGSMLAAMYNRARDNAPFAEIWGIAIPESDEAVRADGIITIKRAPTKTVNGTLIFWVAGRPVTLLVRWGETVTQVRDRLITRMNSLSLPVVATAIVDATNDKIKLEARWAGGTGNGISLAYSGPRGRASAANPSVTIARATLEFTQTMQNGMGEYGLETTFAVLGDRAFDVFVVPYTSNPALDAIEDFMYNRWGPFIQQYGHAVGARAQSDFQMIYDHCDARNDPHMSILGIKLSVVPVWEWAAALGAVMTVHWAAPPELSRPLQSLQLLGMSVGTDDDESFDKMERDQLLSVGCSTFHVDPDYNCRIDRIRTLRKRNVWNDLDPSWADAITMFQAQFFVKAMRAKITGAFPRAALTNMPTGINGFTSPLEIRVAVQQEYRRLQSLGLVENYSLFSQYLVVERNPVDRNRVDILMRPDMVNQLRIVATIVETHLEIDPQYSIVAAV